MHDRKFVFIVALAFVALSVQVGSGYITSIPSYDTMAQDADLIVIATPVLRKEVEGNAFLPGVSTAAGRIAAVAIETTFRTSAVLKGSSKAGKQFVFLHYRQREKPQIITAGPQLIDFEPGGGAQYLMFLNLRKDGRYEAYDEVEPGWCIEKLQHTINVPFSER